MTDEQDGPHIGRREFVKQATFAATAGVASLTASQVQAQAQTDAEAEAESKAKEEAKLKAKEEAKAKEEENDDPSARWSKKLKGHEIRDLLGLEPHQTCGHVKNTYKSVLSIAPGGLPAPFADGHPLGTALYFMVTPKAPVKLHRIKNDQLYHYYLGDPSEVLMLHENGDSSLVMLGPNLRAGQQVQLLVPGNTFHTARLMGKRRWFLGGSTQWPGVVREEDIELGDVDELANKYSDMAADIRDFPVPAKEPVPVKKPLPVKE
jgi:predicted cupin superfamily sugar epimerase